MTAISPVFQEFSSMFLKQDLFQASSARGGEVPVQWELGSIIVHQTGVSCNKFYPTM